MGRSYAACLGCLALAGCIIHGLMTNQSPDSTLVRGLTLLFPFALIGWVVGHSADQAIRHSVEMSFRARVERFRQKNSSENADPAITGGIGDSVKVVK